MRSGKPDRKRTHALCATDQHALNIRRGGGAAHQHAVAGGLELGPLLIGGVHVGRQFINRQQHYDMLAQMGKRVDGQLGLAQKIEPISAMPKGARTTVTSMVAASCGVLTFSTGSVPFASGTLEQITLASGWRRRMA